MSSFFFQMIYPLFQSVKQLKLEDGTLFALPMGPAFFKQADAQEWLSISGLESEGYAVVEVQPAAL